jgi:hypothetical protein
MRPSGDRGPGGIAVRDDRGDRRPRSPIPPGRSAAGPGRPTRRSDGQRAEFISDLVFSAQVGDRNRYVCRLRRHNDAKVKHIG